MQPHEEPKRRAFLHFFGLETGSSALLTLRWTLPYVLALGAGLAGISWMSSLFLSVPTWVYVVAVGLAELHIFLFLARVRELDRRAREEGERQPEE